MSRRAAGVIGVCFALSCIVPSCRSGFDADDSGGQFDGAVPRQDSGLPRSPGCEDFDLGSALGDVVATGHTAEERDDYQGCGGSGAPDVSYKWVAPDQGEYLFDLCSSPDIDFDTVLSLRTSCVGMELACDDDGCGSSRLSRFGATLDADQEVIIVVDALLGDGAYTLAIHEL